MAGPMEELDPSLCFVRFTLFLMFFLMATFSCQFVLCWLVVRFSLTCGDLIHRLFTARPVINFDP